MARLGVPVGERVRKLRAVGDLSGPSWDKVNERAWKNYFCLLAAALLDGIFEHPASMIRVSSRKIAASRRETSTQSPDAPMRTRTVR